MGFAEAIKSVFMKYATFAGRARRAEFWWFVLFSLIAQAVLGSLDRNLFGGGLMAAMFDGRFSIAQNPSVFSGLYSLAVVVPTIAVTCRRLHDVDRSGWWILIWVIPLIGFIIMLVWTTRRGTSGPNRFGPDPIAGTGGEFQPSRVPQVPRDQ